MLFGDRNETLLAVVGCHIAVHDIGDLTVEYRVAAGQGCRDARMGAQVIELSEDVFLDHDQDALFFGEVLVSHDNTAGAFRMVEPTFDDRYLGNRFRVHGGVHRPTAGVRRR